MTKNNIPDNNTQESPEQQQKKNIDLLESLKKGALDRELGDPINPGKFDDLMNQDMSGIVSRIGDSMLTIQSEDVASRYSRSEIDTYCTEKKEDIKEQILRRGKKLVFFRERIVQKVQEDFPMICKQRSWKNTLKYAIGAFDERGLERLLRRRELKHFLKHKVFSGVIINDTEEYQELKDIFGEDFERHFSGKNRKRLDTIFSSFSRFGTSPSRDDIAFILHQSASTTSKQKIGICKKLDIQLTFKQAYDMHLIDDVYIQNSLQKLYGEAFTQLADENKNILVRSFRFEDTISVPAADFNQNALKSVFKDHDKKIKIQTLAQAAKIESIKEDHEKEQEGGGKLLSIIRSQHESDDDYKEHEQFLKLISHKSNLAGDAELQNLWKAIPGLEKLNEGGIIRYKKDDEYGYIQLSRITDKDGFPLESPAGEWGVEITGLATYGNALGKERGGFQPVIGYDDFYRLLMGLSNVEIIEKDITTGLLDGKFIDNTNLGDTVNAENILQKLNEIDIEGSKYDFKAGTYFTAPAEEIDEHGQRKITTDEVWKVEKINESGIDLLDSRGVVHSTKISLQDFFKVVSGSGFKRIAYIPEDNDFLSSLKGDGYIGSAITLDDGNFVEETEDHHTHKKTKEKVQCFAGENGHIRVREVKGGVVYFGEYEGGELAKEKEALEKGKKKLGSLYRYRQMTYGAFSQYLKENELKAASNDLLIEKADHVHGHEHSHAQGSFWSRIFKMQNPASIWKGLEMVMHGIEHTLEKGAKLDAARFALKTAQLMGSDALEAQVYADVVDGSKEIIEKHEKKIFNLAGPKGRHKAMHIVHNLDSRPEEVIAAMNFMMKSYGHLYAEDNRHWQSKVTKSNIRNKPASYFAYFDALVITNKLPGGLIHWRQEAYKRAAEELGNPKTGVQEGEPTEEHLIHALCKLIDGNEHKFPFVGATFKAMGGPSGFENMTKEAYTKAKEKGMNQTKQVNADGRLNKAMSYFKTHELNKAVGAMESMAGKIKSPKYQAIPFVWAVGGYSQYMSHNTLQELKKYAEFGLSFHAYSFLRKYDDNKVYKATVQKALAHLEKTKPQKYAGSLKKFDSISARIDVDAKYLDMSEDPTKGATVDMKDFWQEYQGDGLNDMLQGKDGWLISNAQDGTIAKYMDVFETGHSMQLNDERVPGNDLGKDWHDEHGLHSNPIWKRTESGLRSAQRTLDKMKLGKASNDFQMTEDVHNKLWLGVLEQIQATKNIDSFSSKERQKQQYLSYRAEVLKFFRIAYAPVSGRGDIDIENWLSKPYQYWNELAELGIDPHEVFDESLERNNRDSDSDYQAWLSGGRPKIYGGARSGSGRNTESDVAKILGSINK